MRLYLHKSGLSNAALSAGAQHMSSADVSSISGQRLTMLFAGKLHFVFAYALKLRLRLGGFD